jgi:hypothetical protein
LSGEECPDSLLPVIQEKLRFANYPASDLLRMILTEQLRIIQELNVDEPSRARASYRLQLFRAEFAGLRAVATLVRQTEKLMEKQFEFDGPVVTLLYSTITDWVEQVLQNTIGKNDPATAKNVMLHLSDLAAVQEPELRRKVNKLLMLRGAE